MKEKNYDDFTETAGEAKRRRPLFGQIELTYRCGLTCFHCYCKNASKDECRLPFWQDVIGQIHDLGGMWLTFTGGDPLLHQDFSDIYKFSKKSGFLINIFTSGYDFNEEILNTLEDNPPLNIEITLNSLEEKNYEIITRRRGAFAKVMRNICEIRKRGLPLVLKCNGLKENKDEILKIKEFTEELLGKKKFKFDPFIIPGLRGEKAPKSHRLTAEEIIDIERSDGDMLEQLKKGSICQRTLFNPSGLYHCNSWFTQYFINPQGALRFCHLTDKYSADLRKEAFKTGFDGFLRVLSEKRKRDSKCVACEYKKYCYHCPARAYLETGDEEAPVEYYCQLAKAAKDLRDGFKIQQKRSSRGYGH
jgi:radical SAM protein with 4Fe4S-binding SPASM domain